jgi:hypothetical protein
MCDRAAAIGCRERKELPEMNTTALIRPAWTPATIALMVIGFLVFWPLGLAMLAYILWGDRLHRFKHDFSRATDDFLAACRRGGSFAAAPRTGNVAFDEWREKELARIEEERRKLDEMREEFDAYLRELRRAKDQEEFDRFMAERGRRHRDSGGTYDAEPGKAS